MCPFKSYSENTLLWNQRPYVSNFNNSVPFNNPCNYEYAQLYSDPHISHTETTGYTAPLPSPDPPKKMEFNLF
jgi:hypothetical protein